MQRVLASITAVALGLAAQTAYAQSHTFDFEDGTDQGWGTGFGNDASKAFPIVLIGGSNRMEVVATPSFQEAGRETSDPASTAYLALLAASANEAGYVLSYDYYIDTANWGANAGTFMQLGTYINTGSGYYAQNFPGVGKELELNQAQLTSGQVFQGTVSQTFAAKGFDMPLGETFFRPGLIINGDGTAQTVYFDNITIAPIPEPASLALLTVPALALIRRRRA